jgi:Family of unknown function (DUF6600)
VIPRPFGLRVHNCKEIAMSRLGLSQAVTLVILSLALFPPPAGAGAAVDVGVSAGFFHDRLAVNGEWVALDPYGSVWAPRGVPHGWRPYCVGRWAFTDAGWTWVSDEPWGWATDHYGRWAFDPVYGWVWIPDTVWGPAWVAWRWGGGFVGWAPLPPGVDVLGPGFDAVLDPFAFTFVEARFLVERHLAPHVVPAARNVTLVRTTTNVTRYERVDARVVDRGVAVGEIERSIGHPIAHLALRDVAAVGKGNRVDGRRKELAVYRPALAAAPAPSAPVAARAKKETADSMERRQAGERRRLEATEAEERARLQALHDGETRGRPAGVSDEDLQKRHEAERQEQEAHELRERQLLEARHQREREGAQPPRARAHADTEHRHR